METELLRVCREEEGRKKDRKNRRKPRKEKKKGGKEERGKGRGRERKRGIWTTRVGRGCEQKTVSLRKCLRSWDTYLLIEAVAKIS